MTTKNTTKRIAAKPAQKKSKTETRLAIKKPETKKSKPKTILKKKTTNTRKPAEKRTTTKKSAVKKAAPKKIVKRTISNPKTSKKTVKKAAKKSSQKKEFMLQKAGLDKQGHQKLTAVRVYKKKPNGWREIKGASTAPVGYKWIDNGKSLFKGEYKSALVKE